MEFKYEKMKEEENNIKLNIGSGIKLITGFTNIDIVQIINPKGKKMVDIVMDIEKEVLPYGDNTVEEIIIDNVLEHVSELRFLLNECHRVLKPTGIMRGMVPVAGTIVDFKDPTHKRHFIKATFSYFTGSHPAFPDKPSRPKYADYGYKPWHQERLDIENDLIFFVLKPRK